MKRLLALTIAVSLAALIGCSDDDNPTAPKTNPPVNVDAPVLAPIGAQTGYVNEALTLNVIATDADSTVPELSTSTMPDGATFVDNGDGTGAFDWTPQSSDIGSVSVTFYAYDAVDPTDIDSEVVAVSVTYHGTATSTYDVAAGYWRTQVNASSYDNFMGFSFTTQDTTLGTTGWDIAFKREAVKLNGGTSTTTGGDAVGANLGVIDFADVTLADTAGAGWTEDAIQYFIDDWYDYNPVTHSLTANMNVYSMVDAEGDNYVKFQIDSLVGAGMPPNMGTVYMTYYYQPTADSRTLNGATTQVVIPVGSTPAYFDFSSGSVVTPADPVSSMDWDIGFSSYNLMQNSGPNGPGECAAFYAYTELTDPTDIDGFLTQPSGAPMFPDIPSSIFTDWYNYTGAPLHQLLTKGNVYLVKTDAKVYRVKIESYYANVGGVPTSGWYTYIWSEL